MPVYPTRPGNIGLNPCTGNQLQGTGANVLSSPLPVHTYLPEMYVGN